MDYTREQLKQKNKDELIEIILGKNSSKKRKKQTNQKPKKKRKLKHHFTRHVALKLWYLGSNYRGFQEQEGFETIESELFKALLKCRMIEDKQECEYSRCGRTDKGVSATCNVVSLKIRSKLSSGIGFPDENESTETENEIQYAVVLNKLLPPDIRILGWAPVPVSFSARFSCKSRAYRYFFFADSLSIDKMQIACQYLIGKHDFRNFCKPDIVNVSNFVREMLDVRIDHDNDSGDSNAMCSVFLRASGFLWHQIRNIMTVLFLVGKGIDSPEIVKEMLDLKTFPSKPQYRMADDLPLVLVDCEFPGVQFVDCSIESDLALLWRLKMIPASVVNILRCGSGEGLDQCAPKHVKRQKSLKLRQREPSIEDRVSRLKGKDLEKYRQKQEGYRKFLEGSKT